MANKVTFDTETILQSISDLSANVSALQTTVTSMVTVYNNLSQSYANTASQFATLQTRYNNLIAQMTSANVVARVGVLENSVNSLMQVIGD